MRRVDGVHKGNFKSIPQQSSVNDLERRFTIVCSYAGHASRIRSSRTWSSISGAMPGFASNTPHAVRPFRSWIIMTSCVEERKRTFDFGHESTGFTAAICERQITPVVSKSNRDKRRIEGIYELPHVILQTQHKFFSIVSHQCNVCSDFTIIPARYYSTMLKLLFLE